MFAIELVCELLSRGFPYPRQLFSTGSVASKLAETAGNGCWNLEGACEGIPRTKHRTKEHKQRQAS
jgi:hypothetical protein